jgi:pyrroloquinoline quinone (PQQ) biosynthesis protein C
MAADKQQNKTPQQLLDELEQYRRDFRANVRPYKTRDERTMEQMADARRKDHAGGDYNHQFEGERYLNALDKTTRRKQLRKLVDEGGEDAVGGEKVSHRLLARWESYGVGVTEAEVDRLEKEDADPEVLLKKMWWIGMHRDQHFGVGVGAGILVEGENSYYAKEQLEELERLKARLAEWGVTDVERATANKSEHAGIDEDHAEFNADVVRDYVTSPELQEQLWKAYIVRLQSRGGF